MRISDWSSDVCSSDLRIGKKVRVPRGGALGRVRREGRDNEEEWRPPGGGAADRRRRVTGEDVGRVVCRRVAVAHRRAVLVQHVVVVAVAVGIPLVPAGGDVALLRPIIVHVLADEAGAVAGSLQPGGDGRPVVAEGAELARAAGGQHVALNRSAEHTSELQSLMRISYAVFCLKKKNKNNSRR